jgi:IclR family acetate operon transcriptional repressor
VSSVKENQSVRNACLLIEAIALEQPIGVSELARRTGIEKSAAHRLAVSLRSAGWLHQVAGGRWQIAPALGALVTPASTDTLVAIARPALQRVRDATGETAMFVVIDRETLVVRDVADSPYPLRITAPVGSELPLRNSSAIRAIAARAQTRELRKLRELDPGLLDEMVAETRRRGWAINDREVTPDTRVVGAAIVSSDGRPLGALIACAPTSRQSVESMHEIGTHVAREASSVSAAIGALRTSGLASP